MQENQEKALRCEDLQKAFSLFHKYAGLPDKVSVRSFCTGSAHRLIADLHLGGSVGLPHARKMKKIIDRMQPDLIIYAGDIFDNEF